MLQRDVNQSEVANDSQHENGNIYARKWDHGVNADGWIGKLLGVDDARNGREVGLVGVVHYSVATVCQEQ